MLLKALNLRFSKTKYNVLVVTAELSLAGNAADSKPDPVLVDLAFAKVHASAGLEV